MKRGQRGNIGGLCTRLGASRKRMNLSRSQVAEQIGISPSTLADYEIGHRQPSLPILVILAEIYGISTDYLLGREKSNTPTTLDITGLCDEQIDVLQRMVKVMKHG